MHISDVDKAIMFEISYTDLSHFTVTLEHPGQSFMSKHASATSGGGDVDMRDLEDLDLMMSVDIDVSKGAAAAACDIVTSEY